MQNGIDSMCNSYHRAVSEFSLDSLLNFMFGLDVNISSGFVDQDNWAFL